MHKHGYGVGIVPHVDVENGVKWVDVVCHLEDVQRPNGGRNCVLEAKV